MLALVWFLLYGWRTIDTRGRGMFWSLVVLHDVAEADLGRSCCVELFKLVLHCRAGLATATVVPFAVDAREMLRVDVAVQ